MYDNDRLHSGVTILTIALMCLVSFLGGMLFPSVLSLIILLVTILIGTTIIFSIVECWASDAKMNIEYKCAIREADRISDIVQFIKKEISRMKGNTYD